MRILFCLLYILSGCLWSQAQISFQFLPEVQGRTVDGLLQVKILNAVGGTQRANLTVQVNARGAGELLRLSVADISLTGGMNTVPFTAVNKAVIRFGETEMARVVKQSNVFPEGEYEYCFTLDDATKPSGSAVLVQDCFDYELEALSPLSLVEPYDGEQLCTTKPTLVWQPIFPAISGLLYQLTLAEVKEGQSPTEALFTNTPIINQRNLLSSFLPYPSIARDLDTGKRYVWQVTAYKSDLIISRSEVWTFKVGCREQPPENPVDGYRSIEDLVLGNYYLAEGRVLFAMNNPYSEMKLSYSIECLTRPEILIRKLPEVQLRRGRNQVIIPLENERYFKDGYTYLMHLTLPGGAQKTLRFVYKAH